MSHSPAVSPDTQERDFELKHFDNLLTNPFGRVVDEFSREGWFIYFYQEAKGRRDRRDEVLDLVNSLFHCPEDVMRGVSSYPMRAPYRTLADVDDGYLLGIMNDLLHIGYERIPLTVRKGFISDSSYDVAQAKIYYDVNEHVAAAWRSETRTWETLKAHDGCRTQANFEMRAEELGMREPWHPFSKPENRQYLWYRKGQNDNCLYTVVSLGNHFRVALSFPKLEDRRSWPGMPFSVDSNLFSTIQGATGGSIATNTGSVSSKYFGEVTLQTQRGQQTQTMIVTRVYVALVFRQGWIINTHLKQVKSKSPTELSEALKLGKTPGFREIGSYDIPFKYYFGSVAMIRVHHGSEDDHGFTALVDRKNSHFKTKDQLLEIFADEQKAEDAYNKMKALYDEWLNQAPYTSRWQGEGGFDDGPPLTYNDTTWGKKTPAQLVRVKCPDGSVWP